MKHRIKKKDGRIVEGDCFNTKSCPFCFPQEHKEGNTQHDIECKGCGGVECKNKVLKGGTVCPSCFDKMIGKSTSPQEYKEEKCKLCTPCKPNFCECECHDAPQEYNQASIEEEYVATIPKEINSKLTTEWEKEFYKKFRVEEFDFSESQEDIRDFIENLLSQQKAEHCSEINCPECERALLDKTLTEILAKLHTMPRPANGTEEFDAGFYEGTRQARHIIKDFILKENA